ncbi:putative signal peptide-containing protein [Cryptosporidium canis]|uniref:Signal peptide-containing protein n=1 Tax=Cryptosporidium canis TaxID=195482 RepID=A0A9D5HYD9_9CRYT|nr:putative signal peptide-containing protein [Cryptosporidium canis]
MPHSLFSLVVYFLGLYGVPFVCCKRKKLKNIEIENVSGVLSSDLYGSTPSLDLSQTLYGSSLLNDNYESSNSEPSTRVIDFKNVESLSPTNDIFPLRNKEIKNLYMKSIKEKKVSEIKNLNKDIAENYPNSGILCRNRNGEIISEIDISTVVSKLERIHKVDPPSIKEEELDSDKPLGKLQLSESEFLSQDVLNKFGEIFGTFLSIPKETKADILLHIHRILEEAMESLPNLPDIFYGNGIQILLQPFSDLSINPSEILKIFSSLFDENSENFLVFLDVVDYILTSTISTSNISSLAVSRQLKESNKGSSKIQGKVKQQSSNFWYNTICQTIQNIELLSFVYPFLIPPSYKKVTTPIEVVNTPKTPTLGGFKEFLEKGLQEKKTELIETSNTLTQELIFDGWKQSLNEMGHSIISNFANTKSLCIKYNLINPKKDNIDDISESYQIRKFKGLFKDFKEDEELTKHDKVNYLNSIGLQASSIKLSTDERQSIITASTNFLLDVANTLSEIDLLSKCYFFISNSNSIENKTSALQMDPELGNVLKQPYLIEKVPLGRWKYIITLIPPEFKKSCTIALHIQYIECYNKYKQLHYTLQQPTVVGKIILKLKESSDVIGESAAKTLDTSFSWKSLYQADATFTYYFSILDLNRLVGFNQIIINVVSRQKKLKLSNSGIQLKEHGYFVSPPLDCFPL